MSQPAASVETVTEPVIAAGARDDRMPAGIPFIVANEFAERFCFYGINAILTVYLVQFLRFGEADATAYSSLFQAGAYIFPFVGAVVADVFWGKFRTIMVFSLAYAGGCAIVALVPGIVGLSVGLFFVAFGTGGIKPCVSTNVGDQFTSKNQHLIERAFSYFYLAINAGSSISIFFCPLLLQKYGRFVAFGTPAAMMLFATAVFWMGRKRFAVVPPAGKAWLRDVLSKDGLRTIGSLSIIFYLFVAIFWSLWNQSNGQTWTLQARSSLMDKNIGFGITLLPAQIQVVNGLFILAMVPIFTFVIYPLWGKFFKVTPLRKMGVGFFTIASSYLIVARIEAHIQAGEVVSVWWQILAYVVLTASEVLVSITCLEFSYKQAPLRMKSFIMAMFLASSAAGSLITAGVNYGMTRPLHATAVETGADTWVQIEEADRLVVGQKIDFKGTSGVMVLGAEGGKAEPLEGTFLVRAINPSTSRVELMDVVDRKPVASRGTFDAAKAHVNTYRLVGPQYFNFFALAMTVMGLLFVVVAIFYREKTHLRDESQAAAA
jgi:POT family proton-dependent oligopeptide transporter